VPRGRLHPASAGAASIDCTAIRRSSPMAGDYSLLRIICNCRILAHPFAANASEALGQKCSTGIYLEKRNNYTETSKFRTLYSSSRLATELDRNPPTSENFNLNSGTL
jgi:hypothetical protein